jgi:hypothetical protein
MDKSGDSNHELPSSLLTIQFLSKRVVHKVSSLGYAIKGFFIQLFISEFDKGFITLIVCACIFVRPLDESPVSQTTDSLNARGNRRIRSTHSSDSSATHKVRLHGDDWTGQQTLKDPEKERA